MHHDGTGARLANASGRLRTRPTASAAATCWVVARAALAWASGRGA